MQVRPTHHTLDFPKPHCRVIENIGGLVHSTAGAATTSLGIEAGVSKHGMREMEKAQPFTMRLPILPKMTSCKILLFHEYLCLKLFAQWRELTRPQEPLSGDRAEKGGRRAVLRLFR
jgi:hypothetical protein